MSVCSFCGSELVSLNEAEQKVLAGLINSSKCGDLYKLYPHVFEYCPNCLVCKDVTEDDIKKITLRKDDLQKAFENKKIEDVDIFKWARIAELVGFNYEILGDYRKSTLAYKACTDILDLMISTYISKNQHLVDENGETVSLLKEEAFEKCKNALIYSKSLKRLTLGHCQKCLSDDDFLMFLIYFDTLIELGVKDECVKISTVLQKEKHPNSDYQNAINCLIQKASNF